MDNKIDRAELKKALWELEKIGQGNSQKLFKWMGKMDSCVIHNLVGLFVEGFGMVKWPPDLKTLKGVAAKFRPKRNESGCKKQNCSQIDSSQFTVIPRPGTEAQQLFQQLTNCTLAKVLDINLLSFNFNVEAKLKKLVVCTEDESYHSSFNSPNEFGNFGTVVLQIPIGVEKCGILVLEDGTQQSKVQFENHYNPMAVAVVGHTSVDRKSTFTVQSGAGETIAVLIFSLVWNDYTTFGRNDIIPPGLFPELLIHTNKVSKLLSPWLKPTESDSDGKEAGFLCLLLWKVKGEDAFSNLLDDDKKVVRSLMSIPFIDVHCASIVNQAGANGSGQEDLRLEFGGVTRCRHTVANDVLHSPINPTENILCDMAILRNINSMPNRRVHVLVIHPRNRDLSMMSNRRKDKTSEAYLFIRSIEERLNGCQDKTVADNPSLRQWLLTDLEQLVELLKRQDVSSTVCSMHFLPRLFDIFVQMMTDDLARIRIRDLLKHQNSKKWFSCSRVDCPHAKNSDSFISSFVNFICLADGWLTCSDILSSLMRQLLTPDTCSLLSDIALGFLKAGCSLGARETFQIMFNALENCSSEPERINELFHPRLLVLAIHLKILNGEALNVLLGMMEHLDPSQLTAVAEKLGQLSQEDGLSCTLVLEKISQLIVPPRVFTFKASQLLEVLCIYSSLGDVRTVQRILESLCSECISIFTLRKKTQCPLCGLFLEPSKQHTTRDALTAGLADVARGKEAVECSLNMFSSQLEVVSSSSVSVERYVEYVRCVLQLQTIAELSEVEVIEHLTTAVFPRLDIGNVFLLSYTMSFEFNRIASDSPGSVVWRKILEMLLETLSKHDASEMLRAADSAMTSVLVPFACSGIVHLVKTIVEKFDRSIAASTMDARKKFTMTHHALGVIRRESFFFDASNASASWMTSIRRVINYLTSQCLGALVNFTSRACDTVNCFKLSVALEKTFGHVTEENLSSQWSIFVSRLTFFETVRIVQHVFSFAMDNEEGTDLRQIATHWQVFIELCRNVIVKWDVTVVARRLSQSHLVALMQSIFWIGDENSIVAVCRLLNGIPQSVVALADVHGAIVREKRTVDLATSSQHGVLGLNELIDTRIKILKRRITRRGINQQSNDPNRSLNLPVNNLSFDESVEPVESFTGNVETEHSWTDNTAFQKEIAELSELRKKILSTRNDL